MNLFGLSIETIIIFVIGILAITGIILYGANKNTDIEEVKQPKYYKKKFFFSPKEYEFMNILKKTLEENFPGKYDIFPKTRLADIFNVDKYSHHKQGDLNKIRAKHVDFLIVDSHKAYSPILAIELNGTSHDNEKHLKRDSFVKKLFEDNNINFLIIRNEEVDDKDIMLGKITKNLK